MKWINHLVIIIGFSIFTTISNGQNLLKVGPSLLYNVSFFEETFTPAFGIDISYEIGIAKSWTTNFTGIFHYGELENSFDKNITQKDYLFGIQPDIRWYFGEKLKSGYIGFGGDIKFLLAKNYFLPTPTNSGTLTNWEFNIGLTLGYTHPLRQQDLNFKTANDIYINPLFYIGFNPSDQNEYELNFRIGLNFGF